MLKMDYYYYNNGQLVLNVDFVKEACNSVNNYNKIIEWNYAMFSLKHSSKCKLFCCSKSDIKKNI